MAQKDRIFWAIEARQLLSRLAAIDLEKEPAKIKDVLCPHKECSGQVVKWFCW
jgi:hypothetical protein